MPSRTQHLFFLGFKGEKVGYILFIFYLHKEEERPRGTRERRQKGVTQGMLLLLATSLIPRPRGLRGFLQSWYKLRNWRTFSPFSLLSSPYNLEKLVKEGLAEREVGAVRERAPGA